MISAGTYKSSIWVQRASDASGHFYTDNTDRIYIDPWFQTDAFGTFCDPASYYYIVPIMATDGISVTPNPQYIAAYVPKQTGGCTSQGSGMGHGFRPSVM